MVPLITMNFFGELLVVYHQCLYKWEVLPGTTFKIPKNQWSKSKLQDFWGLKIYIWMGAPAYLNIHSVLMRYRCSRYSSFNYIPYLTLHIQYNQNYKNKKKSDLLCIWLYLKYIHHTWQLSPKFPISDFSRALDFIGPEGFCGSLCHNKGPRSAIRGV